MADRKDELRRRFLAVHPEWKGRIWIGRQCVTIRGVMTSWFREPELSAEAEAQHFLDAWEYSLRKDHG